MFSIWCVRKANKSRFPQIFLDTNKIIKQIYAYTECILAFFRRITRILRALIKYTSNAIRFIPSSISTSPFNCVCGAAIGGYCSPIAQPSGCSVRVLLSIATDCTRTASLVEFHTLTFV